MGEEEDKRLRGRLALGAPAAVNAEDAQRRLLQEIDVIEEEVERMEDLFKVKIPHARPDDPSFDFERTAFREYMEKHTTSHKGVSCEKAIAQLKKWEKEWKRKLEAEDKDDGKDIVFVNEEGGTVTVTANGKRTIAYEGLEPYNYFGSLMTRYTAPRAPSPPAVEETEQQRGMSLLQRRLVEEDYLYGDDELLQTQESLEGGEPGEYDVYDMLRTAQTQDEAVIEEEEEEPAKEPSAFMKRLEELGLANAVRST